MITSWHTHGDGRHHEGLAGDCQQRDPAAVDLLVSPEPLVYCPTCGHAFTAKDARVIAEDQAELGVRIGCGYCGRSWV